MKQISFSRLFPLLFLLLCLSACTQESIKTEYTHIIPANAQQVATIYLQDLAEKAGLNDNSNQSTRQKLLAMLSGNATPAFMQQLENLFNTPEEAGIDWKSPLYIFQASSLHAPTATLKITDLKKWEASLEAFINENLCTSPTKAEGYSYVEVTDAGIQLAYNDGTLLLVYGGSSAQLKKLQPAITALMKQNAQQSIHANPHFPAMIEQKGDIRLLGTPDALPFNLRSMLYWTQGTWLTGRMTFENGRIYATIQQADFKGETAESNQPYHPSNMLELSQAMFTMRSGHPFNIELTSEELLTLTNLRVLIDMMPNDPEIQSLYQAIMKIESVNMRGDRHRIAATVVLKEQNVNALKQLVDYGKQLIGF